MAILFPSLIACCATDFLFVHVRLLLALTRAAAIRRGKLVEEEVELLGTQQRQRHVEDGDAAGSATFE